MYTQLLPLATKIFFCQDLTFIRPIPCQSLCSMSITFPYLANKKSAYPLQKGQALDNEPCGTTQIGLQRRPTHPCTSMHAPLITGGESRWRLLCHWGISGHPPESIHHKLIYCTPTSGSSLRYQTSSLLFSVIGLTQLYWLRFILAHPEPSVNWLFLCASARKGDDRYENSGHITPWVFML